MSKHILVIILLIMLFAILGFFPRKPFAKDLPLLGKVIVVDPGHGGIG